MHSRFDRRKFLQTSVSGALVAMAGCTSDSDPGGESNGSVRVPEMRLVFEDSSQFYNDLETAIKNSESVIVEFDGTSRISRDSRMMQEFFARASNAQDVLDSIKEQDNESGGLEVLSHAFDLDLLEHKFVSTGTTEPNGQVIEPTTMMLILGVVFIVAVASVAHAAPYHGYDLYLDTDLPRRRLSLRFKPAT